MAAVLLAVLLCEAALRILLPKYRDAAEKEWLQGHCTGPRGIRADDLCSFDFSDADLVSATTAVGVFGDSFVDMPLLGAPYVLTEPLDYLLNLDGDFTVLNFGVYGYGPGQSYSTYRSFRAREDLDYVLFVYYGGNDIADLVHNRLFDLDDGGRLRQREAHGPAWWTLFASRLHLTYLALDANGRLAPYIGSLAEALPKWPRTIWYSHELSDDLFDHGLEVFRQLIRRWRAEVEASGAKFFVVLLPTQPDYPRVRPLLAEEDVGVVDLNACFASRDEGHRDRAWAESPYCLRNNIHWNELGIRLAAACLDDRLRREAGLPAMAEAARNAALGEYYATAAESHLKPGNLALDSSHYDVYIDGPIAIFAQDDCHADDATERLFAHATPVDANRLPPSESYHSWGSDFRPLQEDGRCLVRWDMPLFPASHILVGQGGSATATLWSGEIVLDQAAFEKTLEDMLIAAGEPIIASDMDVHVHGRRIFYVSDDCQRTAGRTPFFLHVTPMREADLPPERIEHGYDNLDFFQVGATVGERCVVRWQLPDYPIRHIRTGQYVVVQDGEDVLLPRLWEGEAQIGG